MFDGILGMTNPTPNAMGTYTLLYQMMHQKQISEPLFSFYFSREPTVQYGGELILGGIDTQLFTGEITWAPVVQEAYWEINIEEFASGDQATGWCSNSSQTIVDTGMVYLAVPGKYTGSLLQVVESIIWWRYTVM
ncbi:gastricsin [Python bivittatus]|uniref:Gastricsin n=1 Tax=Python bivittatus TaxID=176946 RepID=A0A9F2WB56_PYTBI|nr:gastricsin [Python bivittatus]